MTDGRGAWAGLLTLMLAATGCGGSGGESGAGIVGTEVDLRQYAPADGLIRLYGSTGTGRFGLPVSGGLDCDGDGFDAHLTIAHSV